MLRILVADGTPAAMQAERETFGIPANASLFEAALRSQQPHIRCSSINVADGQELPGGVSLGDFDGLMFSGSPLHIYDRMPEVTRQIDFARAAFTAGLPAWASCWGLQLATVALGGTVRRNPRGRELGVARRITTTAAGRSHPLLATRPPVFDALCSHIDELEQLPSGAVVLAQNEFSPIQALAVQLPSGKLLFGYAVPSRVHTIGRGRLNRDAGCKSRGGGVRSRLCRADRYGPRFPRAGGRAGTPRPGLALRHRPRDLGSSAPYS